MAIIAAIAGFLIALRGRHRIGAAALAAIVGVLCVLDTTLLIDQFPELIDGIYITTTSFMATKLAIYGFFAGAGYLVGMFVRYLRYRLKAAAPSE